MKRYAMLLLVPLFLTSCRAAPPLGHDPSYASNGATTFSASEFSFTYPDTWEARTGDGEDQVVALTRNTGFGLLVVQRYQGLGSLLELQRYEETQAEGPIDVSESDTLGGLPSFRVQSDTRLAGRTVTQISSGALHGGSGYHVGYYYDPAEPTMTATVSELEDILASWVWI